MNAFWIEICKNMVLVEGKSMTTGSVPTENRRTMMNDKELNKDA